MDRLIKAFTGITVIAVFGVVSIFAQAQQSAPANQASQNQAHKKNWKDQAEYDLFSSITKEQDPNKRLSLLDTWKQKYPNTDFKIERLQLYLGTYQKLNEPAKMLDTAKEMLAINPKDIQALSVIIYLTPNMNNTSPEFLAMAEKAANSALADLDEAFSEAKKPATTSEADWKKARTDMEALAHKTLGWIAMQRKNWSQAEQEFDKSLQINPNAGEVDYWMGLALVNGKQAEKQVNALFYFARASSYDGPGSLPAAAREKINAYLTKVYTTYHGNDPAGLANLKNMAKSQPHPPADFQIKSAAVVAAEKEAKFREEHPELALWLSIKKELTGPNGNDYFVSSMKGAAVPQLKGTLISAKPSNRPTELILGISDPKVPEVTLKLESALKGRPVDGSVVEFQGVPTSFTQDPFMVTFSVENSKLTGPELVPVRTPSRRRTHRK